MTVEDQFVVHQNPVWRDRSNFLINAELSDREECFEQLFARQISEDRFEICCIPFFLYDVALGDIVATSPKVGRKYVLKEVVEPSGHYVFRVWFGESIQPRREIADELEVLAALLEWSSSNLLAVDAVDETHAQRIADFLAEGEKAGRLFYETGRA